MMVPSPNILILRFHSLTGFDCFSFPCREDSKNMRCELLEGALRISDKLPYPFEAVSYFWGIEDKTQSIIITEDGKDDREEAEHKTFTQRFCIFKIMVFHGFFG